MTTWAEWLDMPENKPRTPAQYLAAILILLILKGTPNDPD
jgi:hypothetical protein